jgi:anaerobic selenocysteine-containing dehydrogenase
MLVLLAQALAVALPDPGEIEAAIRAAAAAPPSLSRALAPAAPDPSGEGVLRLIVESAIFTGGGSSAFDPHVAALRVEPRAKLHPETAAALGIGSGEGVDLATSGGPVLRGLRAVLSEGVPRAAVAIVDGLPEAPANALEPGAGVRLTAARAAARAQV